MLLRVIGLHNIAEKLTLQYLVFLQFIYCDMKTIPPDELNSSI